MKATIIVEGVFRPGHEVHFEEYLDIILLREKVFSRFNMYLAGFGNI